jgi:hypothetical protein
MLSFLERGSGHGGRRRAAGGKVGLPNESEQASDGDTHKALHVRVDHLLHLGSSRGGAADADAECHQHGKEAQAPHLNVPSPHLLFDQATLMVNSNSVAKTGVINLKSSDGHFRKWPF